MGKRANPPHRKPRGKDDHHPHRNVGAGTGRAQVGFADNGHLLSAHFPLVRGLINADWEEHHIAHILLARRTPSGLTCVQFLVDLYGVGLKDAAIHTRLSPRGLAQLSQHIFEGSGEHECSVGLAQDLVYGGVAWARQHGLLTPPEALAALAFLPPPAAQPDLARFGQDGRPLLIGDMEDIARFVAP